VDEVPEDGVDSPSVQPPPHEAEGKWWPQRAGGGESAPPGPPAAAGPEVPQASSQTWTGATGAPAGVDSQFPSGPEPPEARGGGATRRSAPKWLVAALVAAVVGGAVGAAVAEGLGPGSSQSSEIKVGNANPGPALAGGASIPTIVAAVVPDVVSIDAKGPSGEDQGTGMVVSSSGEVVTNNHVISGATSIDVTLYNQTTPLVTTLIGADSSNDLALLKISSPPSNLRTVVFGDSTKLKVGDAVIAIGNALGLSAGTPTVTSGIVSALGRTVQAGDATGSTEGLTNLIQTDAAINSGNSGGPLVDSAGQVIGMNTAVASSSNGNAPAQNIGFAIPSLTIQKLIPELQKGGTTGSSRAYLGVYVTDETPQLQQQFALAPPSGALVESVVAGSPAGQAGIQPGDVIVGFDSSPVTSAQDLTNAVQKASAGQAVTITLWRGQQKLTVSVMLTSGPAG
jgi:S1-C subfamily serine protease